MVKRVLVTGATGFIGRHTLKPLAERGYEVVGVTSGPAPRDSHSVRWIQADLLSPGAAAHVIDAARPTHLLHLAWYAEPGRFWTDPRNFAWVQASIALLEAFIQHSGSRVVTGGTCAEYDWECGYCVENASPLNPSTPYGVAKHAVRIVQESMCALAGVSSAWARVFLVYGPHEDPRRLVPGVVKSLLCGGSARCTHGRQVRDLLHVEDVADAVVCLLDGQVSGPVNIASARPVALREVVQHIAALLHRPGCVEFGALEPLRNDPAVLAADTRRLQREVGWEPRYGLEHGLEDTIHWWKERLAA